MSCYLCFFWSAISKCHLPLGQRIPRAFQPNLNLLHLSKQVYNRRQWAGAKFSHYSHYSVLHCQYRKCHQKYYSVLPFNTIMGWSSAIILLNFKCALFIIDTDCYSYSTLLVLVIFIYLFITSMFGHLFISLYVLVQQIHSIQDITLYLLIYWSPLPLEKPA